ncbi:MAG: hypothetical protein A4E73_03119 [Syntrophaceae bacterium PtaU1.Bin231]|nr:MAG: hypothetical protein A4E73_03119 [Syntrophaceae bacterium PtaU1.Bin231]
MKVADPHAQPLVIAGEVFGHALGQRRHQHPFAASGAEADLGQEIVHLVLHRSDQDLRIGQARGPDDLLHDASLRLLHFVGGGSRRYVDGLPVEGLELFERQRAVVESGRKPETVLHERLLAGAVAAEHGAELGNRRVALIDDDERIRGEVFDQGRRGLTGRPSGDVPGIVLDPLAVPHLLHYLQVEVRPLLQALRLQELVFPPQFPEARGELLTDRPNRPPHVFLFRHVMTSGIDRDAPQRLQFSRAERIDDGDRLDRVAEELDAQGPLFLVGRKDLDHVPADAEGAAVEVDVVAFVLNLDEAPQHLVALDLRSFFEEEPHAAVFLRRTQAVDAGNARHDDDVPALQKGTRRGMTELVDLLVDGRVLLDVGVRAGNVGLGLVVVVVTDEILDGVVREKGLELAVELGGQGLVVGDDQRRSPDPLDDLRHGEGLSRSRDPEEHLVLGPFLDAPHQFLDRPGLIAPGFKLRHHAEIRHPRLRAGILAQLQGADNTGLFFLPPRGISP